MQQQPPVADQIELYGGGIFGCFDDMGICIYGTCCPPCAFASAAADAGEMGCIANCCCMGILPCWVPICTVQQEEAINQKLGGQSMGFKRCVCQCCCFPCSACQLARAVKNAKTKGLLRGAPQSEEMAM